MPDGSEIGKDALNDFLSKKDTRRRFLGRVAKTVVGVLTGAGVVGSATGCTPTNTETTPTNIPTYPTITPKEVAPVITKEMMMEAAVDRQLKIVQEAHPEVQISNIRVKELFGGSYEVVSPIGSNLRSFPEKETKKKDDPNYSVVGTLEQGAELRASFEITYDEIEGDGTKTSVQFLGLTEPDLQEYSPDRDRYHFNVRPIPGIEVMKVTYIFACKQIATIGGETEVYIQQK